MGPSSETLPTFDSATVVFFSEFLAPDAERFRAWTGGELVLDEADRMLSMDFEEELNRILDVIPRTGCRTSLFSATMTSKVKKLQRASLTDPVKVEVSSKYATVKTLLQQYMGSEVNRDLVIPPTKVLAKQVQAGSRS